MILVFLAGALTATIAAVPAMAQQPPMAKGDPREAVALAPGEVETLLAGMRIYLESIEGIVEVTAENKIARISTIASKAGSVSDDRIEGAARIYINEPRYT